MATRADAQAILEHLAGPTATLRDDQWTAIEALVVDRRRALVVQRTGWGKSAVYFIATKLLREQGAGATVIVSPLLALMRNQIDAAARAGIHAHTINSANLEEWDDVEAAVQLPPARVARRAPARARQRGDRLHLDRRPGRGGRGVPAGARARRGVLHGAHRDRRPPRRRAEPDRQQGQGVDRDVGAGDGVR